MKIINNPKLVLIILLVFSIVTIVIFTYSNKSDNEYRLGDLIEKKFPSVQIQTTDISEIKTEIIGWEKYNSSEDLSNLKLQFPNTWQIKSDKIDGEHNIYELNSGDYRIIIAEFLHGDSIRVGTGSSIDELTTYHRVVSKDFDLWWSGFDNITSEEALGPYGNGLTLEVIFFSKIRKEDFPETFDERIQGMSTSYEDKFGHRYVISIQVDPTLDRKEMMEKEIDMILATIVLD